MKPDLNNVVVKNLNPEMGKEIVRLFKVAGYDTRDYCGSQYTEEYDNPIYYGIINAYFNNFMITQLTDNTKVLTLEELKELVEPTLKFPRQMRIWDTVMPGVIRTVLMIIPNCNNGIIAVTDATESAYARGDTFTISPWRNAEELPTPKEPTTEEITLKALNEKHGTNYKIIGE